MVELGDGLEGDDGEDCEICEAKAAAVAWLLARSFRPNSLTSFCASYSSASLTSSSSTNLCLLSRSPSSRLCKVAFTLFSRLVSTSPILARSLSRTTLTSPKSASGAFPDQCIWPVRPPACVPCFGVRLFPTRHLEWYPPARRFAFAGDWPEMLLSALPRLLLPAWRRGPQAFLLAARSGPGERRDHYRCPWSSHSF